MLENIISFILSLNKDVIQNVYLVRKNINENFFTSAFIIRFTEQAGDQRGEIMHKIFCYLDAYPEDWQFSLFDYDDVKKVNVEKIEGSVVYRKSIGLDQYTAKNDQSNWFDPDIRKYIR